MWDLVKKNLDLIVGFIVGLVLSYMAHSDSEKVRLIYSVIILLLACMALCRTIRQAVEQGMKKRKKEREHNLVDGVVDKLVEVKTISYAQDPTKAGEKIGKVFIKLWEVNKTIMKKLKVFFDKFKGIILSIALGILTLVEGFGGYINQLCGGVLEIKGVDVIPLVTLIASIVVGIISNGWTKEQKEKIKALFSTSTTNELVKAEIKKAIKEDTLKYTQANKDLSKKETELENLKSEHESLTNTYNAKKEMYNMIPQLATEEDVQSAATAVSMCEKNIVNKEAEIEEAKTYLENLTITINSLKSQI